MQNFPLDSQTLHTGFFFYFKNSFFELGYFNFNLNIRTFKKIQEHKTWNATLADKSDHITDVWKWRYYWFLKVTILLMSERRSFKPVTSRSRLSRLRWFSSTLVSKYFCLEPMRSSTLCLMRADSSKWRLVPSTTCWASRDRLSASLVMLNAPVQNGSNVITVLLDSLSWTSPWFSVFQGMLTPLLCKSWNYIAVLLVDLC